MHEGWRRNPRVVVPWARDAAFDIRQEIGSRAARAAQPREETTEEAVGSTDIEDENDVIAREGSEDVDR
jgi:hypothetical protein